MAEPMKIRATHQGDITEIRVMLQHPMETGQRKDPKTGQNIPAHFIQVLSIAINGKPMIQGQLNTSVSRNPVLGFRLKGPKPGDKVQITWQDNRGEQRSDEATIVAGQ